MNMDGKGDIIDQANEAAEIFRKLALSQRAPEGPAATGFCFNCEARLAPRASLVRRELPRRLGEERSAPQMAPREPDPE
jgi:hypothetical protein